MQTKCVRCLCAQDGKIPGASNTTPLLLEIKHHITGLRPSKSKHPVPRRHAASEWSSHRRSHNTRSQRPASCQQEPSQAVVTVQRRECARRVAREAIHVPEFIRRLSSTPSHMWHTRPWTARTPTPRVRRWSRDARIGERLQLRWPRGLNLPQHPASSNSSQTYS